MHVFYTPAFRPLGAIRAFCALLALPIRALCRPIGVANTGSCYGYFAIAQYAYAAALCARFTVRIRAAFACGAKQPVSIHSERTADPESKKDRVFVGNLCD